MGKRRAQQEDDGHPLLEWAATEKGIYNEELATVGNLVKVTGASSHEAHVLRYVFDRGGRHRPVDLPYAQMAEDPWINASEKTVSRAVLFWEELSILEIERDRGRQLPNTGRLRWSSVLQRLLGGSSSVSTPAPSGDRPGATSDRQAGRAGGISDRVDTESDQKWVDTESTHVDTESTHADTESTHADTESTHADTESTHAPKTRSPIRVLTRARGLLSLSLSIVVDVDNYRAEVSFAEVWELADQARLIVWPVKWPRDPAVKQIFVRGAVLGLTLFDRKWVIDASRATQAKRPDTPSSYWVSVLRNGLVETQGLPPFPSLAEARSYISQLLHAASKVADDVIAEYGRAELVTVGATAADNAPAELSPEAKAFKAKADRQRELRRSKSDG